MNYLSHLFFSQRTPHSFAGNMMGDFKPSHELRQRLPDAVLLGIENHRLVDRSTDSFEGVRNLKPLISTTRRRFAGVITDIAFDYFLIKHWQRFATFELQDFIKLAYQGLSECQHLMPERMQHVTSNMIRYDWLNSYATLEGISTTIDHVSRRIRFRNNMAGGVIEIQQNYEQIECVFLDLFAHIRRIVEREAIETSNRSDFLKK